MKLFWYLSLGCLAISLSSCGTPAPQATIADDGSYESYSFTKKVQPLIADYEVKHGDLKVRFAAPICSAKLEVKVEEASCTDCFAQVTFLISQSDEICAELDRFSFDESDLGVDPEQAVVVNAVKNDEDMGDLSDDQICDLERQYLVSQGMPESQYDYYKDADFAPYYRTQGDRNSVIDWYPCSDTVHSLAGFWQ